MAIPIAKILKRFAAMECNIKCSCRHTLLAQAYPATGILSAVVFSALMSACVLTPNILYRRQIPYKDGPRAERDKTLILFFYQFNPLTADAAYSRVFIFY